MPVRILPADHCGIRFPLTDRFVWIGIIFIRHRPPDIVKSAEAIHDIFDIKILLFLCHVCIPPTVIGMQKDPAFASQCIGCGKCEQHCPQHIRIRAMLKKADRDLRPLPYKIGIAAARKFMSR